MSWATVSSRSCFCWLYRASPSLAAKNRINLISVLTIWWCPCVESSLVRLFAMTSAFSWQEYDPLSFLNTGQKINQVAWDSLKTVVFIIPWWWLGNSLRNWIFQLIIINTNRFAIFKELQYFVKYKRKLSPDIYYFVDMNSGPSEFIFLIFLWELLAVWLWETVQNTIFWNFICQRRLLQIQ